MIPLYQLQKDKNARMVFYACTALALICAILNLAQSIFDTSLSLLFYQKANITSVMYVLCHLLFSYIPLLLVTPIGKFPKALILRYVFFGISVCFLLGNVWVIYYISQNGFSSLFSSPTLSLEMFQRDSALMFNYMFWNCYTPLNVVFSLISTVLFFICALTVTEDAKIFTASFSLATLISVVVPSIYYILQTETEIGQNWNLKNIAYLLASQILVAIAFIGVRNSNRVKDAIFWRVSRRK